MRNDYNPIRKAKKVAKAVPMKKRRIQKPILMPPVVIAVPFFQL